MKTYLTFGQVHVHRVEGVTYDCDCVAVITAENEEAAREIAFKLFGDQWFTTYPEDKWNEAENLPFYPRGYIYVN